MVVVTAAEAAGGGDGGGGDGGGGDGGGGVEVNMSAEAAVGVM